MIMHLPTATAHLPTARQGRRAPARVASGALLLGLLLVIGALPAALSCSASRPELRLPERVKDFNKALRWARMEVAQTFVLPIYREDFVAEQERLGRQRRVTEFEIREVRRLGDDEAEVRVMLQWVGRRAALLRSTVLVQTWKKAGETWFVTKLRELAPKR